MAVKKIEELNIHRDVNSTEQFDVQGYLNENWDKMQDVVDNNAEELMQVQKDISTLKEDNKTNKLNKKHKSFLFKCLFRKK